MALCADLLDLADAPLLDPLDDAPLDAQWESDAPPSSDAAAASAAAAAAAAAASAATADAPVPAPGHPAWELPADAPLLDPLAPVPPEPRAPAPAAKRLRAERGGGVGAGGAAGGATGGATGGAAGAHAAHAAHGRSHAAAGGGQAAGEAGPAFPTVSRQRPKQYKRPTPSKFCHVCGRKSHNVQVAVCSRIEQGMCRKVVCKCCFEKYGWDVGVLDDANKRKRWVCSHCLGQCVAKAQCNTYGKTNYKRHLKLRKRRVGLEQQRLSDGDRGIL